MISTMILADIVVTIRNVNTMRTKTGLYKITLNNREICKATANPSKVKCLAMQNELISLHYN